MFCQNLLSPTFPYGRSPFGVPSACAASLSWFSWILSHSAIFCPSLWLFVSNIKHLLVYDHSLRTETGSGLVFYVYHHVWYNTWKVIDLLLLFVELLE